MATKFEAEVRSEARFSAPTATEWSAGADRLPTPPLAMGTGASNLKSQKIGPGDANRGLHSCVVRIRAEDQHLAEDIIEGLEFPRSRIRAEEELLLATEFMEGVDDAEDKAMVSQLAYHVNNMFLASGGGVHHRRHPNPSPLGSNARPQPISMRLEMIKC